MGTDMEYDVILRGALISLIGDVNNKIKDGWIPMGGVAISESRIYLEDSVKEDTDYMFAQAMIRHDKKLLTSDGSNGQVEEMKGTAQ